MQAVLLQIELAKLGFACPLGGAAVSHMSLPMPATLCIFTFLAHGRVCVC